MSKQAKRAVKPAAATAPRSGSLLAWHPYYWTAIWLAAAACALYARSWHYGFVGDDAFVIAENAWTQQGISALPHVASHSLYFGAVPLNGGLYRPLAGAYYVIVGALVGLRPAGYHIAQILLYGANVATLFLFLRRLTARESAVPLIATLLFLAHPIHTEVVDNIKSADEMLCLQFLLLAAIAWLAYADTARGRWRYLSLAAYAAAVSSKETAVPMAIVLPAIWYFFRQRSVRSSAMAAIPFAGVAALYLTIRHFVLAAEPPTNIVTVLNNALLAASDRSVQLASAIAYLGRYVRMLFWPYPLSFDYSYNAIPLQSFHDPVVWVSAAVALALAGVFVAGVRHRRIEAFAVLWFTAAIAAVSNLLFLISTNFGERLLYLPSVAACLVAAHLLCRAAERADSHVRSSALRSPVVAAPLLLLLSLGSIGSIRRTRDWRDQTILFREDVKKYPNSARLNDYFGNLLYFEGERLLGQDTYADLAAVDLTEAKEHLLRGLSILGKFQEVHAALGMAEYKLRDCHSAIPHLKQAVTFEGQRESAIDMLADCYKQLQMPDGALALFAQLDAEGIEYPLGWFELGNAAAARGDDNASVLYFTKFIAKRPDNIAGNFNLASALYRRKEYQATVAAADRCAALNPTPDIGARCLLLAADALMKLDLRDAAYDHFARAKILDPTNPWIRK